MSLKHRKKRNTALVYEFLVRRMASTMVDQDPDAYIAALQITKKYFQAGQPLAEEKALFDAIVQNRGLSEKAANAVLGEVMRHARGMDERLLEIKKSNLIKDVNYTFGPEFFSVHRIREYRLLASIQMLIDRYRNQKAQLSEDVEKIKLEEGLVTYMTTSAPQPVAQPSQPVDTFVATLAMKKFEERYSGALNEGQRVILRNFMNYEMTGDEERFNRFMTEERADVLTELSNLRNTKEFLEDNVMAERLAEAVDKLRGMANLTGEGTVQEMLLYRRLLQEINSNE